MGDLTTDNFNFKMHEHNEQFYLHVGAPHYHNTTSTCKVGQIISGDGIPTRDVDSFSEN